MINKRNNKKEMNTLSNWKTYLKFLSRNKGYTAVELFGLSVSLMFVLIIAIYTWQELSTDQFQARKERIYLVGNENNPVFGAAVPYMIKERYPEVEKVCPMVIGQTSNTLLESGETKMNAHVAFMDSTFFDIFSFRLLQGDPKNALVPTSSAVLTESFARKMFGTEDVLGRSFSIDTLRFTVSGVVEDLKHSTIPEDTEVLLPWRVIKAFNPSLAPDKLGNAGSTICVVLAHEGADLKQRADDMCEWMKTFFWPYERGIWKEVRIETLDDFYFSGWGYGWPLHSGDRRFVLVLMSVGILILLFAVLNYINLTVAQAGFRAKEMATRRLLGSSRMELFWRLMSESILMCLAALLIAVWLVFLVKPVANDLLQTRLDLAVLTSPIWIGAILLFVVVVGSISGWLPATVISNAKPIEVVRGTLRTKTKMTYSKVFITFQNFITIVMLSCSIVMVLQILHMVHAPVGYNTKGLYWVEVYNLEGSQQLALRDKLSSISGVVKIGRTQGLPMLGSENKTSVYDDGGIKRNISFQQYPMDKECFELLGLKVVRDNQLANPRWYLNEEALRQMNLPQDAPSFTLEGQEPISIAGIVSDFREGNINQRIAPVMFRFMKPDEEAWLFLVQIEGDAYAVVNQMQDAYQELTGGFEMSGEFYDRTLQDTFYSQIRLAKIVGVFTVVAILISLLGLLAMSTYFIQQRSLEVAVRKVFGSDNKQILVQLIKTFLMYVVFAFVIAVPVAYYFMSDWLADYSYRITLNPLIFIAAGVFCLLISFLTVFYQSWHAANANPIDSFRNRNM